MLARLAALPLLVLLLAGCGSDDAGNGVDRAFADQMIPHHQGAIDMAELAEERARTPFVRELSANIIRDQQEEIATLKRLRSALGDVKPADLGGHGGHGEMMMGDADDVAELAKAEAFDRTFLEMMIPHHESAIVMARAELDRGEHDELKELAEEIIEAQEREIAAMRDALASPDAAG